MADFVDVRVNLADVENGLEAMKRAGGEMGRVFRALKPFALADQAAHRISGMGPDGPWPARARSTQDRLQERSRLVVTRTQTTRGKRSNGFRVGSGSRIRTRRRAVEPLGTLPRAIRIRADQAGITIEAMIEWASAHRDGATVGRGSRLPARDFLWWSEEFVELAVTSIEEFVIVPWTKGATAFRVRPGRFAR